MKARRLLLLIGVVLALVASAPAGAGNAAETRSGAGTHRELTTSPDAHVRGVPGLAVMPASHRVAIAATRLGRKGGANRWLLAALGPIDGRAAPGGCAARLDGEADARLHRASNTPCSVRGPPVTA